MGILKGLIGKGKRAAGTPSGPPGKRAYAIGDVHGCDVLLDGLLDLISHEEERLGPCAETYLVFLGDLIDRGPHSAQVIERLRTTDWDYVKPVFLMGNHEEMLLRVLGDEPDIVHDWLYYGGYQCAQSYGLEIGSMPTMAARDVVEQLRRAVPKAHLDFLRGFVDSFKFGDFLFVHAGIRPGVPIDRQALEDLRWIREGFLDVSRGDGLVVVHGHTISDAPDVADGRIGIDTGAYRGGGLTAIRIEQESYGFLHKAG